jgi:hypothetical protein
VVLCSGVLFGYYCLALRNRTFHQWNRFYLLACVVLSLVAPLLKISIGSSYTPAPGKVLHLLNITTIESKPAIVNSSHNRFVFTPEHWAWLAYTLVCLTLLFIIVANGVRIYHILRFHPKMRINDIYFLNTDAKGTPFSFFHYIVWNRAIDLKSETGQRIFRHELAHVQQRHTLDKVFLLLLLVPFWMNPFFWLIRKELAALHEFSADQKALTTVDTAALAQMILYTAFPQQHFLFANYFFQSTIKRRIAMFTKLQNPKVDYLSRVIALPVLLLMLAAFAVKTKLPDANPDLQFIRNGSDKHSKNKSTIPKSGDTVPELHKKGDRLFYEGRELVGFVPDVGGKKVILLNKDRTKKLLEAENGVVIKKEYGDFEVVPQNTQYISTTIHNTSIENAKQFKGQIKLNDRPFKGTWQDLSFSKEEIELVSFETGEGFEILFGIGRGDSVLSIYTKSYFKKIKSAGTKTKKPIIQSDTLPYADLIVRKASNEEVVNFKGIIVLDEKRFEGGWNQLPQTEIDYMQFVKGSEIAKQYGIKPDVEILMVVTRAFSERLRRERDPATKPIFTKTEIEPKFPDENGGWKAFLERNLNTSVPASKGAKPGTYEVIVQFIVDEMGVLSKIKPLTSLGYGMEEEVVRLMQLSPKWIPAMQNGRKVTAYKKQIITFVIPKS